MFLHSGFKFDRFGDELEASNGGISETELNNQVRQISLVCGVAFNKLDSRITEIEKIGKLYSVTDTYFSTNRRRIVSVKPGVDKTDVVIMSQLNEVHDKVKDLMKGIEVTKSCIKIKGERRICNVKRAKEGSDVVTRDELIENRNKN